MRLLVSFTRNLHMRLRRRYGFQILTAWRNNHKPKQFFLLAGCIHASWWHQNYQSVRVQFHRQQVVNVLRN